jgi:hypothetical protein
MFVYTSDVVFFHQELTIIFERKLAMHEKRFKFVGSFVRFGYLQFTLAIVDGSLNWW